ncbi:MAG: phage portal protein [Desulfobacteraceae bacterium]|nr:phage portal protein [Desulfobacteraceae bacterium]
MSGSGPNMAVSSSLASLRARSRELTRNNLNAQAGVESYVSNLIGTGIIPRWRLEDQNLKADVQQLWSDWTEEADANGALDFYGLQALASRALIDSGEVLARFRPRYPGDLLSVPLQIQLLESDHLDETFESIAPNGNPIRMEIEFDKNLGKRVAYWVFRDHPGEQFLLANTTERVRVPATEMLHIFRPLRPGQARGRPWLTSIIVRLHELDQYEDAELVRKKAAAMFGGFITEPPTEDVGGSPLGKIAGKDTESWDVVALEPGTFPVLPPGMEVTFSTPADVGGNYEVWIKQTLREIAAGIGVTYEQLTGDLSGVNYSSIRAGLLEFRRRCEMLQWHTLIFQFCQPVARRWMDTAVAAGLIGISGGYSANRRKYYRIEWRAPRWPWVDPMKDAMAALLEVRGGFRPRSSVIAEMGEDAEDVDRQYAEDAARADSLDLVFDSDPRKTEKSGAMQTAQDTAVKDAANA